MLPAVLRGRFIRRGSWSDGLTFSKDYVRLNTAASETRSKRVCCNSRGRSLRFELRETRLTFHPLAQRNAFRRRDARLQCARRLIAAPKARFENSTRPHKIIRCAPSNMRLWLSSRSRRSREPLRFPRLISRISWQRFGRTGRPRLIFKKNE